MPSFIYVGMILMVVAGGAAWYHKSTQATIMELTQYNAVLTEQIDQAESVNKQNTQTILNMQSNYEQSLNDFKELQDQFTSVRRQNNELKERLGKHELSSLALAKPALVQKVINKASEKAGRCFELLSGAELNEKEKDAKNAKEFNSECPWIYDDLVNNGVLINQDPGTAESTN